MANQEPPDNSPRTPKRSSFHAPSRQQASVSHWRANAILGILLILTLVGLALIVLNAINIVPSSIVNPVLNVVSWLGFIAGIVGLMLSYFLKEILPKAQVFKVVITSVITTIVVVTVVLGYFRYFAQMHAACSTTDPYTRSGVLAFCDPLIDNSKGLKWDMINRSDYSCIFKDGSYHVIVKQPKSRGSCLESAKFFGHFVLQVQLSFITGNTQAGVCFGSDGVLCYFINLAGNNFEGYYELTYTSPDGKIVQLLESGFSASIVPTHRINLVTIVDTFDEYDLYINMHHVSRYTHQNELQEGGFLGFAVQNDNTQTEVAYTKANVWTLS